MKNCQLELRHQRTCDVLFDIIEENNEILSNFSFNKEFYLFLLLFGKADMKTKEYIYKMIETLLPKANIDPKEIQKKINLKMMEMF